MRRVMWAQALGMALVLYGTAVAGSDDPADRAEAAAQRAEAAATRSEAAASRVEAAAERLERIANHLASTPPSRPRTDRPPR